MDGVDAGFGASLNRVFGEYVVWREWNRGKRSGKRLSDDSFSQLANRFRPQAILFLTNSLTVKVTTRATI
jgi:hypothetical protein